MIETRNLHLNPEKRFTWILPLGATISDIRLCDHHGEPSLDVTADPEQPHTLKVDMALVAHSETLGWTEDPEKLPSDARYLGQVKLPVEGDAVLHAYVLSEKVISEQEVTNMLLESVLQELIPGAIISLDQAN